MGDVIGGKNEDDDERSIFFLPKKEIPFLCKLAMQFEAERWMDAHT